MQEDVSSHRPQSFQNADETGSRDAKYFQYSAMTSNIFNSVSCICVSTYFIWLTIDPLTDEDVFLTHTSIRLRIATSG